jgi:NAD(P)-dependent dehydrogenase (short-subunit alcohol dehydrogenase family)
MTRAIERFGRIHAAVNNAGIEGRFGPVQDATSDDFDRIIGVNLKGVWLGMKYQVPHMIEGGGGSIINLASTAALVGLAYVSLYAATKHAIAGLTKSAALELAPHGIRVNAIAPGPVDTGLLHAMRAGKQHIAQATPAKVPLDRVARPDEMAGPVVWLASDASSYVTGAIISVDGGVVAQ